jgi:WD40 repeat protein
MYGEGVINSLAFAHSIPLLAMGINDRTIRLLDLITGEISTIFHGHTSAVQSVAFAPDDRTLASCSDEGTVRIWRVPSGKVRTILTGHAGRVWCAAFAPDGKTLATTGKDGTVRLWDPAVRLDCVRLPENHSLGTTCVAFSKYRTVLATAGSDRMLRLWDYKTGRLESSTPLCADVHQLPQYLRFSSDGRRLAAFSSDSRSWAAGLLEANVSVLDLAKQSKPLQFRVAARAENSVPYLAFMEDDKTLLTNLAGKLRLWDAAMGQNRGELEMPGLAAGGPVGQFAVTADGKTLAFHANGAIIVGDLRIKRWHRVPLRPFAGIDCMAISPDQTTLACGLNSDRTTMRCDVASASIRAEWVAHTGPITKLAFTPDGKTLAGFAEDIIKLWNVATGQELLSLESPEGWVTSLAFSPDGRTLASGHGTGAVYLWRTAGPTVDRAAPESGWSKWQHSRYQIIFLVSWPVCGVPA